MRTLIDAAFYRRRTVIATLMFLLIVGAYAYIAISKEAKPDINIPVIYVSMTHEGISPEDAETLLIRPMEQELSTIDGVKEMTSKGFQGSASVSLEFDAGFDSEQALSDVREAVDKVEADLPEDTEDPSVNEVNFSLFPVLVVTLSGEIPERVLLKIVQRLQDKIEALDTVLEAKVAGDRDEQLEIVIDSLKIESYNLNVNNIIEFLRRSDKLVAAGNLDTGSGRFAIKVPGLFETIQDIENMPLKTNKDSVVLTSDVAKVKRNFKDPDSFARFNGRSSIALEVVKRSGENVIETIEAVREVVLNEQERWPPGIFVNYTQDSSERIRIMLSDLQNNIISAVILVMIICVIALGVTSAGLVGIAIPGAFLTGVLVIYMMGLTINVVVLFALILSVGMLVDGAIVVIEYADRKMLEGLNRMEAYRDAAKRMSWPIIASTATTLAAFCPLLFWPGIMGQFMRFMPITLIAVLTSSLLMALIFIPVLGSLFGRSGLKKSSAQAKSLAACEKGNIESLAGFTGRYIRLLDLALRYPGRVLLGALLLLIGIQSYYAFNGNGVKFFPDIEPDFASVLVHARGNMSIYEQDMLIKEVEREILGTPGIRTVYTRTGKGRGDLAEDVIGVVQVEFTEWDTRKKAKDILNDIRDKTAAIPGIVVEAETKKDGPPTGKDIQVQIRSDYPELLEKAVETLRQGIDEIGGFIDVEDSRPLPGIEWELQIDRVQAAKFGLDTTSIGQSVRLVTNGLKVSEYLPKDAEEEIDVIVRYPIDERSLEQLDQVQIETPMGSVPISNFVKRVAKPSTGQIERAEGSRMIVVKAGVPAGLNVDAKVKKIEAWLRSADIDPRVQVVFKGEDEEQRKAKAFLSKAFIVALFIMMMILVTQFNSFYSAFLILSSVIMSTIGVMIGLLLLGKPFGVIMSGIGVIALAGIVVNNNIVLIDTFDKIRDEGKFDIRETILHTGAQRLRPVLLTTITTVLGLMPMVLQMNIDFLGFDVSFGAPSTQWWVGLASAVAFGLVFSTPLTLIVTPCALMFRENIAQFWKKRRSRSKTPLSSIQES